MSQNIFSVPGTPVQKKDCYILECKKDPKGFKTSQGLKGNMKKFHDVVIYVLSPVAETSRVLFQNNIAMETPSVQGNSKGQTNYPEVMSAGIHKCDECEQECASMQEIVKHKKDKHDKSKVNDVNCQRDKTKAAQHTVNVNDKTEAAIQRDDFMPNDQDLVDIAEDIEMQEAAKEVEAEVAEVIKMVTVDKIVD